MIKGLGILVLAVFAIVLVGWLALLRPDIGYDRLEAKYADAASRYIDLPGGVHMRYRDQGQAGGHVLVLVHGFSASAQDWDDWARILSPRYRIITLDLPGHGLTRAPARWPANTDSYADLVAQATDRLGVKSFVLAGNSMGGGVAWDFALRHPDRLQGLVLVDAAGWAPPKSQQGGAVIFQILRNPVGRAILRDIDTKPLIAQGLKSAFVDEKLVTPALVDRYSDFARAPGHRAILMALQTGDRREASYAVLAAIKAPTLVMHGRDDHLIPFANGEAFARAIPGATLIAYPGVGHVPMEQIPDRSAADLDAWLRTKVWP
ncbi:alpha/beta fold hydrolase [Phenylobacterium montanum]|uniref:Alpha/beta hydrolase n=1 Tax=Phenylobacterium montanum TaxID=2823693 RepID=A0A975IYT6_9CAUL|nr:alpha/beta hydrolase [Caulobacter sp. S6]QUD90796.1 alpha/beta hydrolase [Caulobacter sp. S6]